MPDTLASHAYSLVATAPSPATSGTSLVVTAGEGARFPSVVPFDVEIWATGAQPSWAAGGSTGGNFETAICTARSTDTLTITRAQRGTTARTIVVGDQVAQVIDKKLLDDMGFPVNPLRPAGAGLENIWRQNMTGANLASLTSGKWKGVGIGLPNGFVVTTISFLSGTTAIGTPTHQFAGLYDDSAGTTSSTAYGLLRGSNDLTNTAWAATSIQTFTLTSPYTTTRAGFFYLGLVVVATTPPSLTGLASSGSAFLGGLAPLMFVDSSATGLTALPNPATGVTGASNNGIAYAYVS